MVTYKQQSIQQCLDMLNELTISGIHNAEKVAVIARILMNPLPNEERKEKTDGSREEEQTVG